MNNEQPHTSAEILKFIQERVGENGVTIARYDKNNRFKAESWAVRGCGVNASGLASLTEAFEVWIDSVIYLEKERERNGTTSRG